MCFVRRTRLLLGICVRSFPPPYVAAWWRRMATAPRPPAFVSSAGPPARQRRAALDFLARELQALEIESRVKQDLETRVSSLERDLHRSEQLNAQYLRRIDMLEQQLRHARGEGPAPAEQEAASSGGEVFQGLATMVPPTCPHALVLSAYLLPTLFDAKRLSGEPIGTLCLSGSDVGHGS